ncbi:MAG TPA: NAD(P)-dependent alcohol dehydrogenase [Sorangium sp.]|nr:NAD(P)-dependent alcohol dehydrogenase [Sorangium sp.]
MKTITYARFGGPEVLALSDTTPPPPSREGRLLVRMHAVSLNPLDGKIRRGEARLLSGARFPKTPGIDFAGVVEGVGPGVVGFSVGDRVFGGLGSMKEGYLSELISVPARVAAKMPANLDFVGAASVAVVGLAALQALRDVGRVKAGARVLVNGCTGGIGPYALQLAKRMGAHVTGVCGTEGVALARDFGADAVVDYRRESITSSGQRFDVVLDLSTRLPFEAARVLLAERGTYVGFEPAPAQIIGAAVLNIFRAHKHRFLFAKATTSDLGELGRLIGSGELRLAPTQVFELSEFRRAFELAEKGGVAGKIVIRLR